MERTKTAAFPSVPLLTWIPRAHFHNSAPLGGGGANPPPPQPPPQPFKMSQTRYKPQKPITNLLQALETRYKPVASPRNPLQTCYKP